MANRPRFLDGEQRPIAPQWIRWLFPVLILTLAFLFRLVALNRYITPDEAIWVYRSILFREALLDGRWADTLVAGHPGVTTTWLGALGITLQLWLSSAAGDSYDWLVTMAYLTPDNVAAFQHLAVLLNGGRITVALANSIGVVGIYFLAYRIWGRTTAIVAALFLTFDPFLVGLSGILHVDGLSATFATLSLLAMAVGLNHGLKERHNRMWLAFAGGLAGLAVLTKMPTLLLLPVSGLALLWIAVRDRRRPPRQRLAGLLVDSVVWGLTFAFIIIIIYPAVWSAPATVLSTVSGSANRHLAEALRETYFLGRAAYDHGPLFYPVVLLWRLSPVVWLSLVPAIWLLKHQTTDRRPRFEVSVGLLILWAVLFLVAITPAAKKFDRYILPVVPALLLLAAIAWSRWASRVLLAGRWLLPAVLLIQSAYWLSFAFYPLAAYNPLLGGPHTAVHVLPIGWGEGIGASGKWLTQSQPLAEEKRAVSGVVPSLAPFFSGTTLVDGLDDPATADYTIVTLGGKQLDPTGFQASVAGLELIHTERFGRLDQAWVYRNPNPAMPAGAESLIEPVIFGERMALDAFGQTTAEDLVNLRAQWRRLVPLPPETRLTLRIAIRDRQGNVWASQESDLLNEVYFYPPDWEKDETGLVRYTLELPPGIPPGSYEIVLSIIDNQTAGQLPARVGDGDFQGVEYVTDQIIVPVPESIVLATRLQIPVESGEMWQENLQLLGHNKIAAEALAGSRLPIDLFWHVPAGNLSDGMLITWHLIPTSGSGGMIIFTEPLSRYDTGRWRTGETIQEKYRIPLPPDLSPGEYRLAVEPISADGASFGSPFALATIQVNNIDRQYELPQDIAVPLDILWQPLALAGASPAQITTESGQIPELVLYWTNRSRHGEVYTVFLHVLDNEDNIVLYADHWPGGLPTDILDNGQVIIDRVPLALPAELPEGDYRIRLGLYIADSGERLPVVAGGEGVMTVTGADSVLLPVPILVTKP